MMNRECDLNKKNSFSRWDFYSLFSIVAVAFVTFTDWPKLPFFMDCYYHLATMRGFSDAGGWVGQAFWEYAPTGRPHLYPPLFHFLELILFKNGVAPLQIARLFDFFIFPLFLLLIWFIIRDLVDSEVSFFSIFLMGTTHSLYLAIVNNIPFSLSFMLSFSSFYFFKKQKPVSSSVCLALALYTHPLMPWLMIAAFIFYSFFQRNEARRLLFICAIAVALALPLLLHQLKFYSFFRSIKTFEFYTAEINPILLLLAAGGAMLVFKKKGDYLFFFALLCGMSLLLFTNRDRFLSGQGVISFSFLAALILTETRRWLLRSFKKASIPRQDSPAFRPGMNAGCLWEGTHGKVLLELFSRLFERKKELRTLARGIPLFFFFSILVFEFVFLTPLVLFSPLKKNPDIILESWIVSQLSQGFSQTPKGETIYNEKFVAPTVALLKQYSDSDDIFFSNYDYAGGMIAALSDRATSGAMLREVKSFKTFDSLQHARFVLWFKELDTDEQGKRIDAVKRYGLKKIGETDLAYLYLNNEAHLKRQVIPAIVPTGVCFLILFLSGAVIILENTKIKFSLR
jgi:hypothetical protein